MLFFKPRVHGSTAMQEPQCKQGIHRVNLTLLQVRSCAGIPLAHKRSEVIEPGACALYPVVPFPEVGRGIAALL